MVCDSVKWIELVQDMAYGLVLVNVVINLRVSQ
jgi:hypothetical protein